MNIVLQSESENYLFIVHTALVSEGNGHRLQPRLELLPEPHPMGYAERSAGAMRKNMRPAGTGTPDSA